MKVIFVNNYLYIRGGSERVLFDEIEILRSHGHEPILFSRKHEKNIYSRYSKYFPVSIKYEECSFLEKIFVSFKLIYSLEVKKKFSELLSIYNPDLVHAHNIYGRLTTSVLDVAKNMNVPVVMTLHDYKLICPSYLMLSNGVPCEKCKGRKFYNCILTRCHKNNFISSAIYSVESYFNYIFKKYEWTSFFLCPSKFLLKKHIEFGIPSKKLVYLPNFIKVNSFLPNFQPGNYILYVGRLSKEKGILTLLKAMKTLKIELKIIGDGPLKEKCKKIVRNYGLRNVLFEGYKYGDELEEIYKNAAFVVIPSECYENAPMVLLETFSYGKPAIGSDIGGIPEFIIDGETGYLFEPGNYNELREKISYLYDNPSIVKEMGKKARKIVEKNYSEDVHYKKLISLYNRVV